MSEDSDCNSDHVILYRVEEKGQGSTVFHWAVVEAVDYGNFNWITVLYPDGRSQKFRCDDRRDSFQRLMFGDGRFTLLRKAS